MRTAAVTAGTAHVKVNGCPRPSGSDTAAMAVDADTNQRDADPAAAEVAPVSEAKAPDQPPKKRPSPPAVNASEAPRKKRSLKPPSRPAAEAAAAAAEGSEATGSEAKTAAEDGRVPAPAVLVGKPIEVGRWGPTASSWPSEVRRAAAATYNNTYRKTLKDTNDKNRAVRAARMAKTQHLDSQGIKWRRAVAAEFDDSDSGGDAAPAVTVMTSSRQALARRQLIRATCAALRAQGKACSAADAAKKLSTKSMKSE